MLGAAGLEGVVAELDDVYALSELLLALVEWDHCASCVGHYLLLLVILRIMPPLGLVSYNLDRVILLVTIRGFHDVFHAYQLLAIGV